MQASELASIDDKAVNREKYNLKDTELLNQFKKKNSMSEYLSYALKWANENTESYLY